MGASDQNVALNAFKELELLGLIERTFLGFFTVKAGEHSRASAWRLTWIGDNARPVSADKWRVVEVNDLPPRARKRLQRRQTVLKHYLKDYQQGKYAAEDSIAIQSRSAEVSTMVPTPSAAESEARHTESRESGSSGPPMNSSAHILYHGGQGISVEFIRNDLANFWRAASADDRIAKASELGLTSEQIEQFLAGSDLPGDKAEQIWRAAPVEPDNVVLRQKQ